MQFVLWMQIVLWMQFLELWGLELVQVQEMSYDSPNWMGLLHDKLIEPVGNQESEMNS